MLQGAQRLGQVSFYTNHPTLLLVSHHSLATLPWNYSSPLMLNGCKNRGKAESKGGTVLQNKLMDGGESSISEVSEDNKYIHSHEKVPPPYYCFKPHQPKSRAVKWTCLSRQSNCFKKRFALAFDNLLAFLETFYSWFFFHPKGPFLYISSNLFFACYLWPCKTNLHVDCKGTHSFAAAVVSHF